MIIAIAQQAGTARRSGRTALRRIAMRAESLLPPFVREAVALGAHVHTDGCKGHVRLGGKAASDRAGALITASLRNNPSHVHCCGHRVAACSKPAAPLGTHQGGVKGHQLDDDLDDEFTSRFSTGAAFQGAGHRFHRLAEQAAAVPRRPSYHHCKNRNPTFPRGCYLRADPTSSHFQCPSRQLATSDADAGCAARQVHRAHYRVEVLPQREARDRILSRSR